MVRSCGILLTHDHTAYEIGYVRLLYVARPGRSEHHNSKRYPKMSKEDMHQLGVDAKSGRCRLTLYFSDKVAASVRSSPCAGRCRAFASIKALQAADRHLSGMPLYTRSVICCPKRRIRPKSSMTDRIDQNTHLASLPRLLPLPPHGIPSRVPLRNNQHPLPLADPLGLFPSEHLPPLSRQLLDLIR
jgi:hypothetical protein